MSYSRHCCFPLTDRTNTTPQIDEITLTAIGTKTDEITSARSRGNTIKLVRHPTDALEHVTVDQRSIQSSRAREQSECDIQKMPCDLIHTWWQSLGDWGLLHTCSKIVQKRSNVINRWTGWQPMNHGKRARSKCSKNASAPLRKSDPASDTHSLWLVAHMNISTCLSQHEQISRAQCKLACDRLKIKIHTICYDSMMGFPNRNRHAKWVGWTLWWESWFLTQKKQWQRTQ